VPTYLDVAVVRIQSYLARTPKLRGRRGASALLAHELMWERVKPALGESATSNPEAGAVDGVISLILKSGADPQEVARWAFAALREQLPAAELRAVWGGGETYAEAVRDHIRPVPALPPGPHDRCRVPPPGRGAGPEDRPARVR
jgi:hypothetical protein